MNLDLRGMFERIFGNKPKVNVSSEFKALTAYAPAFTSYSGQLYESALVRSAINARATAISKLKVEFAGHGAEAVGARLSKPNNFMTWSQFLYKTSTALDVDNTVFICPVFDSFGRVKEIFPVTPHKARIVGDTNDPHIAMEFSSGRFTQLPVWQVGTLTKFQYKNDFFGESNRALSPTMELINIQNQGIEEGVKSAATYRFMAQLSNFSKAEDLAKERKRFNKENMASDGGGLLLFPSTYSNIQKIDSKPFVADAEQMNLIQKNVFDYFGVNEDILQNKAFGDAWSAFYEGAVEPFAIQFSEVMTDLFILCKELSGKAQVFTTANRLQYMTNADKLNVSAQMADRGLMSINEIRDIWNLPPVEGGENRPIRGEYYMVGDEKNGE